MFPKKDPSNPTSVLDPAEDLEPIVEAVLDGVDDLYIKAGARSFVLVDIPPIDHSPQGVRTRYSCLFSY